MAQAGKEGKLSDKEIADQLIKENEEYRKLDEEHRDLENILVEIDRKVYLTTEEEVERKRVQKLKLLKKDRMAEIVREHRKTHSN